MELPNIYKQNRGFTLIEIIIVLAILGFIISAGVIVDLNAFKNDTIETEEAKVVAILEKARSRAVTNFFNSSHGVCYIAPNYIIFRESDGDCVDGISTNELVPANTNLTLTFPPIIFNQLSGDTTVNTIHLTDGIKNADIHINDEGAINW